MAMGLDEVHYGQNDWNPLEQIFRPGKVGLTAFKSECVYAIRSDCNCNLR